MSNSNYMPQQQVTFPENFIVILIHGWTETASNMDNLVNTMRGLGSVESYWNCVFSDITITKNDLPSNCNVFSNIQHEYNQKTNANVFIKIAFTHETDGTIAEQSEELAIVISNLRNAFPTKKIATVGYSKGGVVAMDCAINHPGYINNLVSVGTPYTTTIVNHVAGFIENCVKTFLNVASLGAIVLNPGLYLGLYVAYATNVIQDIFTSVINLFLIGQVVLPSLKSRWNQLENKPSFTPIATRALVIDGNLESDFVVPVESALASGFEGKKYSDEILLIRDPSKKITINTGQYTDNVFDLANLITTLNGLASITTITSFNQFISNFFSLLLSITDESAQLKGEVAKYAHACLPFISNYLGSDNYALNNEEVAWRVLAGLR